MSEPKKKGTTLWMPSKKDRDAVKRKCHDGETVADMLRRKRII